MTLLPKMKTLHKISVRKFIDKTVQLLVSANFNASQLSARQQKMLNDAGYHLVTLQSMFQWTEMHVWLKDNVNQGDYSWFGPNFWFTHERDAMWFSLKFGGG